MQQKGGASGAPPLQQPSPGQQGLQRGISSGRWIEALLLEEHLSGQGSQAAIALTAERQMFLSKSNLPPAQPL